MQTTSHRVRRLTWGVRAGTIAEAFETRKHLHDRWQELFEPAFDLAFDQLAVGDAILHVPRLDVRIRLGPGERIEHITAERIAGLLREQLQMLVGTRRPEDGLPGLWKHVEVQESHFATLLHYLRTGSLPWYDAGMRRDEIERDLRVTVHERAADLVVEIFHTTWSVASYRRLLQILPTQEALALVEAISRQIPEPWCEMLVRSVTAVLAGNRVARSRHTQLRVAAGLLSVFKRSAESGAMPDLASCVEGGLTPEEEKEIREVLASMPGPASDLALTEDEVEPSAAVPEPAGESVEANPTRTLTPQMSGEGIPSGDGSPVEAAHKDEKYPLTVGCAGIILLHPFIPMLLENTGMKEAEKPMLEPQVLERAAALLYFVATGSEEAYEWELGLINVLLGVHPSARLFLTEGLLAPREKEEAVGMLESAIGHWSILKNASVQGLQSSFLQRRGFLREEEREWRLHVEGESYDVLLDHLPWSIGVVKLPWMRKAILTEWPQH